MVDKQKIQKQLCNAFCEEVKIAEKADNLFRIEAPFYFPDGDPYQLYLKELPTGGFRVSDQGHTWMHLSYEHDVSKFKEGSRGELLNQIMKETGLLSENGTLYMDTTADKLAIIIMQMGQALTKVNDLTFLSRARVENTFYEDLKERIYNLVAEDRIRENYIHPEMEMAEDYPIDYYIQGGKNPLYLFGVGNKDKARLTTIVLERLLGHTKQEFDSMLVLRDLDIIPHPDLKRLMNVGGEMIASLEAKDDLKRKLLRKVAQN